MIASEANLSLLLISYKWNQVPQQTQSTNELAVEGILIRTH